MTEKITSFRGSHAFLSNFWMVPVEHKGRIWKSAEHAFQGAKCADEEDKDRIALCGTPFEAKKTGRNVRIRPDWEEMKDSVMLEIVRAKFSRGLLRAALLFTGDAELVEGNHWGDTHWGVCGGIGKNMLGKTLMQVRRELAQDKEGI